VLGMDNGVTGSPYGAGSVMGAAPLDVLELSVFWIDDVVARVRRFRGLFFGGSFCRLLFPVDGGVAVVTVSGVAVRLLLLLAVVSSLESTSTKTSSSSPSCSTDDGVSLYPRPLSPPLEVRPFCSAVSDSHHLVYPRFSAGAGD